MTLRKVMLIAGEPSGDFYAAELVKALRRQPEIKAQDFPTVFFGAGGRHMAEAGVEVVLDLTRHSVIGLWEVVKKYREFQAMHGRMVELAFAQQPDVIVCVDFSGFNSRFVHTIRERLEKEGKAFNNWRPKIVKYISPQVWASRPDRIYQLAAEHDLLLTIFPFEKAWYAERVPKLHVEYVGHPMLDRFVETAPRPTSPPTLLLLPGSRPGEVKRHLEVMVKAAERVNAVRPVRLNMVLPNESLMPLVKPWLTYLPALRVQVGGMQEALAQASVVITKTGTVTMECAFFRVPTVALYKTSWPTYLVGKQVVMVKYLAMPNLLLDEPVFPEFLQSDATPANLSREALDLLSNEPRRAVVKAKLEGIVKSLGISGANERAARAVVNLVERN